MKWQEKSKNNLIAEQITNKLNISPFLSQILVNRGIDTPEKAFYFLYGDIENTFSPFIFQDMNKTVTLLKDLIAKKGPIFIVGDKDVDGITGTAILYSFFKRAGLSSVFYDFPVDKESYGFSERIFNNIVEKQSLNTVVTVDCGIKEHDFIKKLSEKKINTVITDHHTPSDTIPDAFSIINPHLENSLKMEYLSGSAVALKLVQAMFFSYHQLYDKDLLFIIYQNGFKGLSGKNFVLDKHEVLFHNGKELRDYLANRKDIILVSEKESIKKIKEEIKNNSIKIFDVIEFACKNLKIPDRNYSLNKITGLLKIYYSNDNLPKVLFSLMKKILFKYYLKMSKELENLLEYATLGTVCDAVPLNAIENHIIVKAGLTCINKNPPYYIKKLVRKENDEVGMQQIGFDIGPMLNSSGRMGEGKISFEFLIEDEKTKMDDIFEKLKILNEKRKKIGNLGYQDAVSKIEVSQKKAEVLFYSSANIIQGITGIIANKIARQYKKPSFVFSIDEEIEEVVGSGRCFMQVDLLTMLGDSKNIFKRFGGHKKACGMTFSLTLLDNVIETIKENSKQYFETEKIEDIQYYDFEIDTQLIDFYILKELKKLYPFGTDHENPIFLSKNLTPYEYRLVGKNQHHLRMKIKENPNIDFIGWDMADKEEMVQKCKVDLFYQLEENLYHNHVYLQGNILDIYESK